MLSKPKKRSTKKTPSKYKTPLPPSQVPSNFIYPFLIFLVSDPDKILIGRVFSIAIELSSKVIT